MADLRRRKPDDDSGKQVDDDNFNASKASISGDGANGSDDEQPQRKKPSGLTTADSSDHVNINNHIFHSRIYPVQMTVGGVGKALSKVHFYVYSNKKPICCL